MPTRLSAVDEAVTMDVLCADKTGTLTCNALTVAAVQAFAGFDEPHVLALAALASSDGGQDPIDAAIVTAAHAKAIGDGPKLIRFTPFDSCRRLRNEGIASGNLNDQEGVAPLVSVHRV